MDKLKNSLKQWNKYGEYILIASAYQDHILKEANGCIIRDVDNNELVDLEAGQISSILGHGHPKLTRRLIDQMQKLIHVGTGFISEAVFETAQKIAGIMPGGLKKSLILSTGAEANECAFRIAKTHTNKRGIVGFTRGYAGLSLATMSVSISSRDTSLSLPGAFKIIAPDCLHCIVQAAYPECDYLCLKVSEEILRCHCEDNVAAFIVEPILSAGGMIFPPPGYFVRLKDLAKRMGALLISDEAQTGMGRTGRWFGIEHDGVEPDIIVISKGVGGGFPASAVVVSDEIAENILGRFSSFSSHQSDPIAAVAISSVIDIIKEENLVNQVSEMGAYFKNNLEQLSQKYQLLRDVRGKGLMIGMDSCAYKEKNLSSMQVGQIFESICRQNGVHLKSIHGGKIFRILPPLTISKKEIDKVISVFEEALMKIKKGDYDMRITSPQNPYVLKYKEIH
ncbi:MAG: aspartate aminotransferase family protein, partial [Euryarchaeota archaeon]|nr:aspartate aminotransferase family protein [Euryarchaeota archaeon]